MAQLKHGQKPHRNEDHTLEKLFGDEFRQDRDGYSQEPRGEQGLSEEKGDDCGEYIGDVEGGEET